jgi:hypothetical protein
MLEPVPVEERRDDVSRDDDPVAISTVPAGFPSFITHAAPTLPTGISATTPGAASHDERMPVFPIDAAGVAQADRDVEGLARLDGRYAGSDLCPVGK